MLVERHVVDFVRDQRLVGVLRRHRELRKAARAEAQLLQLLDVRLAIEVVHLVADLAQRVAGVALRVLRVERRQCFAERRVAIPQVLELDELRDQRVELAFVLGRRHEEQDAVEIALLRHDALLAQIVRDHGRGHAEVEVLARLAVDARRQQHQLVRIDHRVAVRVAGVAVPARLRVEGPALLLALEDVGRQIFPGDVGRVLRELRAADGHDVGYERIEEPLLLGAAPGARVVAAELAQLLACFDAERDAAIPQHLARLAVVDLRVHVQRRRTADRTATSSSASGTTR